MGNYAFTYRLHLDCLWDNPTNVVDLILIPTTGQVVVEVADLTKHIKCIHDQVRAQIEKINARYKEVPDKHPIVVWTLMKVILCESTQGRSDFLLGSIIS